MCCSGRPKVITGIDPGQSPHSFGCAIGRACKKQSMPRLFGQPINVAAWICTTHGHLTLRPSHTRPVRQFLFTHACIGETYIHRHNRWCPTRHHSVYDWLPGFTGLCCPDSRLYHAIHSLAHSVKFLALRMSIPPRNNIIISGKSEFGNGFRKDFTCLYFLRNDMTRCGRD